MSAAVWPAPFDDAELRASLDLEASQRIALSGALVGVTGEDADVVVLMEGTVEVRGGGRLVRTVEAPAVLGLDAWLAGEDWQLERRASEDVRYASVSRADLDRLLAERPSVAIDFARHLARAGCQRRAREVEDARAYDELFQPGAAARLLPGPYRFGPFDGCFMVVQDDPERMQALLPAGLRLTPGLGGRYLVIASFVEEARCLEGPRAGEVFGYHEVALFVPVMSEVAPPGMFAVELYPDAAMPVLLGREIYGFPKRLGRIERRRDGLELYIGHARGLRAKLERPRAVDADAFAEHLFAGLLSRVPEAITRGLGLVFGAAERATRRVGKRLPDMNVLVEKHVASEAPSRRPEPVVHQLVEVPMSPFGFEDFAVYDDAQLTIDDAVLPLGGELLAAARCRFGFDLGDGRVLRDYVSRPASSGLLERLAGGIR